ncbi:MAG TPA: hypothetical protein VFI91_12245 [Longimicrobiaceae bacterium]|nr:hypothetical protein [Longimicrobiaceae bacterium]
MTYLRSLAALAIVLTANPMVPGSADLEAQSPWGAGTGVAYERYQFGESDAVGIESLSLLTVPFSARSTFFGNATLEVSGGYARGSLVRIDGTESSISGITDTEVSLGVALGDGLATINAIVLVPTGQETMAADEIEVAGAIASDLLPFGISHWGSGGGVGLGTTLTTTAGDVGLGITAGYFVAGEFDPVETSQLTAFRPGNILSVQLGVDRNIGTSGKATLQLGLQRFGDDTFEGRNLYRSGNRYQAMGSYAFAVGPRASAIVYAGGEHRSSGAALLDVTFDAASQNLALFGGGMRVPFGRTTLLPSLAARILSTSDGVGQGFVTTAGLSAEIGTGPITLLPNVKLRLGRVLVREGSESGITGVDLGIAIRFGGGE